MKKSVKFISTIMAGLVIATSLPVATASAAKKVTVAIPKITVENVNKGVQITWKKAKKAKKYIIQRKSSTAKKFTTIKRVKSVKVSYVDKTAKAGKTYSYRVKAINGKAESVSKGKTIVRLTAPTLRDESKLRGCVYVLPDVRTKGAQIYEIYRAKVTKGKTGSYKKVASLDAKNNWAAYEYSSASVGSFKFKARAVCGNSKSVFSKEIRVDFVQPLEVNTNSRADHKGIDVIWAILSNIEGYRIYRSSDGGEAELITDIKLGKCRYYPETIRDYPQYYYTDTDVTEGVVYTYYVEAYTGNTVHSREVAIDTVEYKAADYKLKVGEVSTELADELAAREALFAEMGLEVNYMVTLTSLNTNVFKIDENKNLVGLSAGKAYLEMRVTMLTEDADEPTVQTFTVLVTE